MRFYLINDGMPDGLETGVITTVPGIGSGIYGTDTGATFQWSINGVSVTVHKFTADADPYTTTDPNNAGSSKYAKVNSRSTGKSHSDFAKGS